MLGMSNEERMTKSRAMALKKARILKGLSRKDLAKKLNVSYKAIEKIENGRDKLSKERLLNIVKAIGISHEDFIKIKCGKKILKTVRRKNVLSNNERRSYQKIINKDAKVLKSLRKKKNISQDQASLLCGYSRPTIGHIENGRISLNRERITHIVTCYGFTYSDFERYCQKEKLIDEVIDLCIKKLKCLPDEKVVLVWGMIESIGGDKHES